MLTENEKTILKQTLKDWGLKAEKIEDFVKDFVLNLNKNEFDPDLDGDYELEAKENGKR